MMRLYNGNNYPQNNLFGQPPQMGQSMPPPMGQGMPPLMGQNNISYAQMPLNFQHSNIAKFGSTSGQMGANLVQSGSQVAPFYGQSVPNMPIFPQGGNSSCDKK